MRGVLITFISQKEKKKRKEEEEERKKKKSCYKSKNRKTIYSCKTRNSYLMVIWNHGGGDILFHMQVKEGYVVCQSLC